MYLIPLLHVNHENNTNLKICTKLQVNYAFKAGTPSVGHISENNPIVYAHSGHVSHRKGSAVLCSAHFTGADTDCCMVIP